jgi:hypothetical protein
LIQLDCILGVKAMRAFGWRPRRRT